MSGLNNKFIDPSFGCIIVIGILAILLSFQWGSNDREGYNRNIISSDGLGYYDYLPSFFITDNFSNKKSKESYIIHLNEDQAYNKYFSGTAIMMSPFFMIGHLSAKIFNYKQDGYSLPYQNSIALGAFLYLLLGLYFISKLLKTYNFSNFTICVTLVLLAFGTNLLYYGIFHPSMSHVYSFFTISTWLYLARKYWLTEKHKMAYLLSISFILAVITLIRPTNALILILFPIFTTSITQWKVERKNILFTKGMVLAILILGVILLIQPLLWYVQTGKWFIWSYAGEGFDFSNPQLFNVLFSFRKGWWVYTPLMLVATIGILFSWKKNKFLAIGLILFLVLFTYITSSWWNWYYGSSFGQRPFVDIYGVLSIGLAMLITVLKSWKKIVLLILCAIFCILNLTQTYQFLNQILSPEYMTKEKYNYVFLEVDKSFENILGGSSDIKPFNSNLKTILNKEVVDFDCTKKEYCGNAITKTFTTNIDKGMWIEVDAVWQALAPYAANDALLVIHITHKDHKPFYFTTKISPIPKKRINIKESEKYTFHFKDYHKKNAEISIYLWNKGKTSFILDTLNVKVSKVEYSQ